MTIDKNDPRLTAFALSELAAEEETSELAAAVEKDPSLQAEVTAIREMAEKLKTALAAEPLPPADPPRPLHEDTSKKSFSIRWLECGVVSVILLLFVGLLFPAKQAARKHIGFNSCEELSPAASVTATDAELADTGNLRYAQPQDAPIADARYSGEKKDKYVVGKEVTVGMSTPKPQVPTGPFVELAEELDVGSTSTSDNKPMGSYGGLPVESSSTTTSRTWHISNLGTATIRTQQLPGYMQRLPEEFPPAARMGMKGEYNEGVPSVGFGGQANNPTKPAKMMVTPHIIVAEEEEESLERSVVVGTDAPKDFDCDLSLILPFILPLDYSIRPQSAPFNTESYDKITENEFQRVSEHPLSTFSIDVDTASYSMVRRMLLEQARMPVPGAVRLEEMINYFDYEYEPPTDDRPFATHVDSARCPWNEGHNLLRIGLKGRVIDKKERDAANLVFLLDVSGSMNESNKLPLLKESMKMLVENLNEKDRVAIVVYAGASGLVLPSTGCGDRQKIIDALDRLQAGGSTNGGAGITLAYATAAANYIRGGTNRVVLCTDGDFNVGTTNQSELVEMIEKKAKEGVFLTVLGFGMGNFKDSTLEKLADRGNGNYGYVDTPAEARKLLVEGLSGTLVTIAKDVKIQVEFNPAQVKAYRLLGYENRMLKKEDFNDDTKDAGEIGAGHTVTALYEIIPADSKEEIAAPKVDALKYQSPSPVSGGDVHDSAADASAPSPHSQEMLTVKLRYKEPDGEKSKLLEFPCKNAVTPFDEANGDLRFAASAAAFGMLLRGSAFKGNADYDKVLAWAENSLGEDEFGYRNEFMKLVRAAKSLSNK